MTATKQEMLDWIDRNFKRGWWRYADAVRGYITTAEIIPEGWKLVPIEPTDEMRNAGRDEVSFVADVGSFDIIATQAYKAMIAAAPKPEESR